MGTRLTGEKLWEKYLVGRRVADLELLGQHLRPASDAQDRWRSMLDEAREELAYYVAIERGLQVSPKTRRAEHAGVLDVLKDTCLGDCRRGRKRAV